MMAPILYILVLFLERSNFTLLSLVPVMYGMVPVYWSLPTCINNKGTSVILCSVCIVFVGRHLRIVASWIYKLSSLAVHTCLIQKHRWVLPWAPEADNGRKGSSVEQPRTQLQNPIGEVITVKKRKSVSRRSYFLLCFLICFSKKMCALSAGI